MKTNPANPADLAIPKTPSAFSAEGQT